MLSIPGIYILDIRDSGESVENLLNATESRTQSKIQALRYPHDKILIAYSDLLIKYLLMEIFSLNLEDLKFVENKSGKPRVLIENVEFNTSHSKDLIVCVIDHEPVGIDIEYVGNMDSSDAEYFLSTAEKSLLTSQKKDRLTWLYDIWTTKESYIKAEGKSLSSFDLSKLNVTFDGDTIKLSDEKGEVTEWNFSKLEIDSNYSATICAKGSHLGTDITPISVSRIKERFTT